jgi:hypothetical protein
VLKALQPAADGVDVARRAAATAGACIVLAWLGMQGGRVPILGLVDLGFHELGHLIAYVLDAALPWPTVLTAAAGSVLQIAVPAGLAWYFLRRSDHTGAAVCLAWAGTSANDVSRYIADAPYQQLPLIGGHHDWATILGPAHLDALHRAGDLAYGVRSLGWLLVVAAVGVALWPALSGETTAVPSRVR